mmetsp:Transcript_1459/g.2834  ORF Transcript_1459/g.2834 Transcript_1459/m.2834 type:complete len:427 (-) Transcript_1459:685-1965(-)
MKASTSILAVLVTIASATASIPLFKDHLQQDGSNWVVLVAGSNTWGNYRHQSDVYHAYQLIRKAGIPDDHIIVFHYDDIAYNSANPFPGVVINSPSGENVYENVPKNYVGTDVNTENFLKVLTGEPGTTSGQSTGGVLQSTVVDNVFIYYADHGGPGILGMPEGEAFLYADELRGALDKMKEKRMFNKLTFYVEACHSGSMFLDLSENENIYVVTAANPDESSYAAYCPGETQQAVALGTCLGDLFSVTWLEEITSMGTSTQTLEEQYSYLRESVSVNDTYVGGSHVMQYGDKSFTSDRVSQYMGILSPRETQPSAYSVLDNYDADLAPLFGNPKALRAELLERAVVEKKFMRIKEEALGGTLKVLQPHHTVLDWQCYRDSVNVFKKNCGPIAQHSFKHLEAFVSLCNAGVPRYRIEAAVLSVCGL